MRKSKWTTANGKEIEVSKLEDRHILNIIKMVERFAVDGMLEGYGGFDAEGDPDGDVHEIYGKEVRDYFNDMHGYHHVVKEARLRKLLPSPKKPLKNKK